MLMAAVMLCGTLTTHGAAVEHIGDRYIIHVDEMSLTGEETLAEVLAMFPDVVDFNNVGANLAHQRFGRRTVALGVTYNW